MFYLELHSKCPVLWKLHPLIINTFFKIASIIKCVSKIIYWMPQKCRQFFFKENNLMPQQICLSILYIFFTGFEGNGDVFFTVTSTRMRFGFVVETVLITKGCFHYGRAIPPQSQGLFCFSHHCNSTRSGDAQECGREHSQGSWPKLSKGIFHTIQCQAGRYDQGQGWPRDPLLRGQLGISFWWAAFSLASLVFLEVYLLPFFIFIKMYYCYHY